ncbi:MAG: hypothetical protein KUG81_08335 [Gammaproteobacteria bacterium]|nr:hypothetical protein [Gammaproteobacteria bacterium]
MQNKLYIIRVVHNDERIELHEYKNKKQALAARDKFRKTETVQSAKMLLG